MRHTVNKFAKIAALLCATILFGVIFAVGVPCDKAIITATAAEPSYQMSEGYMSGKFYKNFTDVKLTGDERKDVIAIALSQLGYHEGNSDEDFAGDRTDGVRDFVEYNVLAGKYDNNQGNGISYGYYWCASFVNWCLRQAGVSREASAGAEISCQRWIAACSDAGIYKIRGSYIPQSGDMIFFRDKGSSLSSTHIGLVLYVDGGNVYTVEGNTSFTNDYSSDGEYVALKHYPLDSDYIVGYGCPGYNAPSSYKRVDYSGAFKTQGQYIPHGRVTLYADEDMTQELGEMDAFTLFDVKNVSDKVLAVSAAVNGTSADGYISASADVLQVTTEQDVLYINYEDAEHNKLFYSQYRLVGEIKKIYSNAPKREGCGFVGWQYKKADGTVEMISAGAQLPAASGDVTLTAVFDSNFYLVSFQLPDKTLISQSYGYYGSPIDIPETPEAPEGYVFAGWDGEVSDTITKSATYTAIFEQVTETTESTATESESNEQQSTDNNAGCKAVAAWQTIMLLPAIAIGFVFKKKK